MSIYVLLFFPLVKSIQDKNFDNIQLSETVVKTQTLALACHFN